MLTEEAIVEQIQADSEMMTVLAIIRDLDLADAWLAAGAVRNFIWNQLSGKPGFDATTDMDLVFYDPTISYEETLQIEQELKKTYPQYAWEVKTKSTCTSIVRGQLLIAVPVMRFPNTPSSVRLLRFA